MSGGVGGRLGKSVGAYGEEGILVSDAGYSMEGGRGIGGGRGLGRD